MWIKTPINIINKEEQIFNLLYLNMQHCQSRWPPRHIRHPQETHVGLASPQWKFSWYIFFITKQGLLDSLSFIGRICGYLFMTFYPTTTPKKDFLKNCIFTVFFLALIPLSSKFVGSCNWMLLVSMLCSGFSRAYVLVPNMIMLQYFDAKDSSDRIYINFWAALGTMGDVIAIVFTSLLVSLGVVWEVCFCLSIGTFFICSFILVMVAD